MSFFKKKSKNVPAKKIALLRKAVNLRKELEEIVKKPKKDWLDEDLSIKEKTNKSLAEYDIPMIDLFKRLKDNEYLQVHGRTFIPHVERYIELLNQEKYNKAIELNKKYFSN